MWQLWKNRNHLIFEGKSFLCAEIVSKAKADADEWFIAQRIDEEWSLMENARPTQGRVNWKPPIKDWVMCNIAVDWTKDSTLTGGAWVLRDDRGMVMCHSRRSFGAFSSKDLAREAIALWAA